MDKIGIFWINGGKSYVLQNDLMDNSPIEEVRDIESGHFECGPYLQKQDPYSIDVGYDRTLREHVSNKDDPSIIYSSSYIIDQSQQLISECLSPSNEEVGFIEVGHHGPISERGLEHSDQVSTS